MKVDPSGWHPTESQAAPLPLAFVLYLSGTAPITHQANVAYPVVHHLLAVFRVCQIKSYTFRQMWEAVDGISSEWR